MNGVGHGGPFFLYACSEAFSFAASLAFVTALFLLPVHDREDIMFWAFLLGNLAYYAAGIALALKLRDNRAFFASTSAPSPSS